MSALEESVAILQAELESFSEPQLAKSWMFLEVIGLILPFSDHIRERISAFLDSYSWAVISPASSICLRLVSF